jgi:exosortase K
VNAKLKTSAQLGVTLLAAYALKSFYSAASVNDLRWILAPTTFFVELITSRQFAFESQAGYMSADHTFLIAASCSGVNFLIISFLALTLGNIWREWPEAIRWKFLPVAASVAYVTTLAANTTRIVVALILQNVEVGWLGHGEFHRVQGIVIYFGFLLALFVGSERFARRGGSLWSAGAFSRNGVAYLLAVYYSVTVGIPLLRGSYREAAFWQHSIVVITIPLVLVVPFLICSAIDNNRRPESKRIGLP